MNGAAIGAHRGGPPPRDEKQRQEQTRENLRRHVLQRREAARRVLEAQRMMREVEPDTTAAPQEAS